MAYPSQFSNPHGLRPFFFSKGYQTTDGRDQKSEVGKRQRSEVGDRRTDDGRRRSEDRGRKLWDERKMDDGGKKDRRLEIEKIRS